MPRKTSPTPSSPNNTPTNTTPEQQRIFDQIRQSQLEFDRQLAEAKGALAQPAVPLQDRIYWDWAGWLPHAFLTILASDPSVGKSSLALRIAATYLDGRPWPDGTSFTGRHDTILWCEGESGHEMHRQRLRTMRLDPADPTHLRLSMVKNNLAPFAGPIGVRIGAQGPDFGPPPQPPLPAAAQSEEDRAIDLLKDLLAHGPLPATQIYAAAQDAAISVPTLKCAKSRLRVKSNKHPNQWTWELPPD